jgi:glucosamine--fructose-6-phosphate aminotransferase (isomerizing)
MADTMMARETREIPEVSRRQLADGLDAYREIGARFRRLDPPVLVTAARGSSDHAAAYLKYVVETHVGRPVASLGPSVASVYGSRLRLDGAALIAISQSGASPDLLSLVTAGAQGGATTAALVNAGGSRLEELVDLPAPLLAGPEVSVAATKSYVASLIAMACIVAEWTGDSALETGLQALPDALDRAVAADWIASDEAFRAHGPIFCVGRGMGFAVAAEAALKFKETCRLHAEAYSSAEVLHGPIALADTGLRGLFFVPSDESRGGVLETAQSMRDAGADVWLVDDVDRENAGHLSSAAAPHPLLTPICQAVSFYVFIERLSRKLGNDPDNPRHLRKVTRTV